MEMDQKRVENAGFLVGFLAFAAIGVAILAANSWLARVLDQHWADMITYIPAFGACFLIGPVKDRYVSYATRRFCKKHGHQFEVHQRPNDPSVVSCRRCYSYRLISAELLLAMEPRAAWELLKTIPAKEAKAVIHGNPKLHSSITAVVGQLTDNLKANISANISADLLLAMEPRAAWDILKRLPKDLAFPLEKEMLEKDSKALSAIKAEGIADHLKAIIGDRG